MKKIINFTFLSLIVMGAGMGQSQASLLQLSHEPLFINQSVPPAIAVTLDDSGSMYWSYMGSSGSNGTDFTDPLQNTLYFNPNIVYSPPLRADGSSFPDSDPNNAKVDGYPNNMNDTVNLTNGYVAIRRFIYNRNDDNVRISFVDTQEFNINNVDTTYQNYHPNWTADRAYYSKRRANGTYETVYLYGSDLNNFANWYTYYNSRAKLSRVAISRAFQGFGPDFKIAWQELNRNTAFNTLNKFELTHKNNFFNWLFKSPTDGGTPLRSAFKRAGDLFTHDSSYYSADFDANLSCQQNFHIAISDGGWNSDSGYNSGTDGFLQDESSNNLPGDTENRYGNYTGAGEQVIYSKSETGSTLSDIAFNSWARDLNPNLNNNVKTFKKDYKNAAGGDLTFAPGEDPWEDEAFVWNPKNDPAYWQHLVTYNVGMGLEASRIVDYAGGDYTPCPNVSVTDPKEAVYQSLRNGTCGWPNADNVNTTKIDDVWHSSINSRGEFFSANDPNELIAALNDVVNSILEKQARGSTSTVSSGIITGESLAFSPSFDSTSWSGNLIARSVELDGTFGDIQWDLSCLLTGGTCAKQLNRKIFTYDPAAQSTVAFDSSLSGSLRTELTQNASDLISRTGASVNDIIDYVRGDQGLEQQNSGQFKDRVSVLADIIHSSPTLVRGPGEFYSDVLWPETSDEYQAALIGNGYRDFKLDELHRKNIVYIGSNSGMLHAIDADTGFEYWAYMPYKAFQNIHRLPDVQASHHSYVDNTAVTRDVFINGRWRTILIGGMRYGGQSYYALDVTNPGSAQPTVLWEFSDEDDPDMGYSYGKADIVRVSSTGEWVALIPNGYNNSQQDFADGSDPRNIISATGNAVMYVVRIADGNLRAKIDTNTGSPTTPNGLSSPIGVDSEFHIGGSNNKVNSKIDLGIDVAYAGDIYGNLWKFDLTDTDPSAWDAEKLVEADTIMHRPITVKPRVVAVRDAYQSAENDVIVMYGTGKYIELPDRDTDLPAEQYLVGVIDGINRTRPTSLSVTSGSFVEQFFSGANGFRHLTNNVVDLADSNVYGWKVELPEDGERITSDLSLFGDQILIAASTVTAGVDPCEPGGESWLMALNPMTGGVPEPGEIFKGEYTIDDGNGNITTHQGEGTGIKVDVFIVGTPPMLEQMGGGDLDFIVEGTEGSTVLTVQKHTWRRRNWTNLLTE